MAAFDVNIITELVIHKLKSEGVMSTHKLYSFKSIGFRTILKHFESAGQSCVDTDMFYRFLEEQYEIYKGNRKLAWRWQLIRRSAELLMYFAATEKVDMPPLPRWTKRDCQLYVEPTKEQLANNDNIHGLAWRTRNALKKFGYAGLTLKYYDVNGFSKILDAHKMALTEIYSRKLSAQLVLEKQKSAGSGNRHKYQAVRKAAALLDEFHRYGTITPGTLSPFNIVCLNPIFEKLVEEYCNDALFSGKLSDVTAGTAKSIIKGFLLDLENAGHYSFEEATLSLVSDVVAKTAANHYKRGAGALLHYVKDFFNYLYEYDVIKSNLSVAVPKIAAPHRKIYQGFSDDEIRKLLASVDRGTPSGKRDYAMMTLAVQTGLRAVDITKLKRGDIDWRRREIHIAQSKTGEPLCLPLEVESGNAICEYLLNARQECEIPNVFLCGNYPLRAMSALTLQGIIVKHMAIAKVKPAKHQRYGFHSFRRAFGARLLESGTPVHILSQLLGHINLDSAKPYLSLSEQGLKECCLPLVAIGGDA